MALTLNDIGLAAYFLSLVYFVLAIWAFKVFKSVRTLSYSWNTTKTFVLSNLLLCCMRFMSWFTICIFDFQEIAINFQEGEASLNNDIESEDADQEFYDKVIIVLWNLPDFILSSTYLLLLLIWLEQYSLSRVHWLSFDEFRKTWMIAYLTFNVCLYTCQLTLYACLLFFTDVTNFVLSVIFFFLAGICFVLPACAGGCWLYMWLVYSGFPMVKSQEARLRLQKVGYVTLVWTCGRVLYGIAAIASGFEGWLLDYEGDSDFYQCALVSLYIVAEIIPIFNALDEQLLAALSAGDREHEALQDTNDDAFYDATSHDIMTKEAPAYQQTDVDDPKLV